MMHILVGHGGAAEQALSTPEITVVFCEDVQVYLEANWETAYRFDLVVDKTRNMITDSDLAPLSRYPDTITGAQLRLLITRLVAQLYFSPQTALATLDNNKNVFKRLLKRYYNENREFESIMAHRHDEIAMYVHKVKGLSLNIGSRRLYLVAKAVYEKLDLTEAQDADIEYFTAAHRYVLSLIKEQI